MSSSTSTSSCTTARACSRACRRTGRPPSRRSRRPACTARRTTTARPVERLVDLAVADRAQRSAFGRGVLHVEGKCTSRGPRIIEVNARMGGGRIYEIVRDVWDVDLIEAQLRSCLDVPPR